MVLQWLNGGVSPPYDELLELLGVAQCNVLHTGGGSFDGAINVDGDGIDSSYLGVGDLGDYEADAPGVVLPVVVPKHTDLHRYDVSKLRPWEVMYFDNKSYPCVVRGGKLVSFVLVDLKTFTILKFQGAQWFCSSETVVGEWCAQVALLLHGLC